MIDDESPSPERIATRVEDATSLLREISEDIRKEDPDAFPDEMFVLNSVIEDLDSHVIGNLKARANSTGSEELNETMTVIPDYHFDRWVKS